MLLQSLLALSFISIPFCSGGLRNPTSVTEFKDAAEGSGVAALREVPETSNKRPRAESEHESSEDISNMSMSDEDTEVEEYSGDEGESRRDPSSRGWEKLSTLAKSKNLYKEGIPYDLEKILKKHQQTIQLLKEMEKYAGKAKEIAEETEMNFLLIKNKFMQFAGLEPLKFNLGSENALSKPSSLASQEGNARKKAKIIPEEDRVIASILSNIKTLITDYILPLGNDGLGQRKNSIYLESWDYFFSSLKFFCGNSLMRMKDVKHIFQEFQVAKAFTAHTAHSFALGKFKRPYWNDFFKLTEHHLWASYDFLEQSLGHQDQDKINLVYLMERICQDAKSLGTQEEYQELSNYLAHGNYFSQIKYKVKHFDDPDPSTLVDPKSFKIEIAQIIKLIMKLTAMNSDAHKSQAKENMQISICYLLGFINEDICPGIVRELVHLIPFLKEGNRPLPLPEGYKTIGTLTLEQFIGFFPGVVHNGKIPLPRRQIDQLEDMLQVIYLTIKYDLISMNLEYTKSWLTLPARRAHIIPKFRRKIYHFMDNYRKIYHRIFQRDPDATFFSQKMAQKIQLVLEFGYKNIEDVDNYEF